MLTDEERVARILDRNDGRVWQSDIVDVTGWSKPKTSWLLSEMEDNESIYRVRVGRRKLVRFHYSICAVTATNRQ